MKDETIYEVVIFSEEDQAYRSENGALVRFPKMLRVRYHGEEMDIKLSYTREVRGEPTPGPVPCIRVDGEKLLLDEDELEIASDCVIATSR